MKMPKAKACVLGILLLSILSAGAVAEITRYLPNSSFWQGSSYRTGIRVDYAVYDTQEYPSEFVGEGGFTVPGVNPGRYVYAYQVFNTYPNTSFDIEFFTILGISSNTISSIDVLGTVGQEGDGIDTIFEWFSPENNEANWQFDPDTLVPEEKSLFLVFSSDHGPVVGDYRVNVPSDDLPVSGELPEPATLLFMSVGAFFLQRRRMQK
ncbi:MAG: PEP-CTERM sorting domain-containing protein [Sedimentisphaerales bacterium]|nr:PEP-CTERM sorting domain-containing protein [Sedimentisphaerales bacterium]